MKLQIGLEIALLSKRTLMLAKKIHHNVPYFAVKVMYSDSYRGLKIGHMLDYSVEIFF